MDKKKEMLLKEAEEEDASASKKQRLDKLEPTASVCDILATSNATIMLFTFLISPTL